MKTVFVADAHLKGEGDPHQASLVRFLDSVEAERLAVLGDLFDFWTGSNRVAERVYKPVLEALLRLRERGVGIIYFEGNHDFSMGPFFTNELGAKVYPGMEEMAMDGKRFLVGHGDTVSMTAGYRLWRAYLRSPLFRATAIAATPRGVWAIAGMLSRKSRGNALRYGSSENITEARLKRFAIEEIAGGFDAVVLGHSHEPGVHTIESGGRKGVYANPGSWAFRGTYLVYEKGEFSLKSWKS
ncbi:MAG: UDP-2,3-diacylglucosamine diphosphatase [Candidatus Methylomirabilis sp.]|nr:UDP-2,3-diacylglucosamine diphosphatase [Deltaproteobacteria bacterium]